MEEEKIKKGLNIYLYYLTIPVFFGFIIFNYFTRAFRIEALDISLMISVVSFLFGFLISIVFSMLLSKTSALKEALATEAGRLASLFMLSKKLGKEFHEKIRERIDEYTVKTLKNYTEYEIGRQSVYEMYEDTDSAEIKNAKQEAAFNSFLYILGEFEPLREKLEYLTSRRIEKSMKFVNYTLGVILIALLFLNRGDTFTNALFVILSTTIIFIFLIMEDYDNLKIGDYTYNISNSEQIFDLIGKHRYYPEELLSKVNLEQNKQYRIGFYNEKTKEEKIVLLTYNPEFKSKLDFLTKKFKRRK